MSLSNEKKRKSSHTIQHIFEILTYLQHQKEGLICYKSCSQLSIRIKVFISHVDVRTSKLSNPKMSNSAIIFSLGPFELKK
jgi:hypothetical protein